TGPARPTLRVHHLAPLEVRHGPARVLPELGSHPDLAGQPDRDRVDAHRLRRGAHRAFSGEAPAMTISDERMWTARLRRRAVAALPPERLLPDRQPAYVASWIYVFGVLTLAALLVVLVSGGILALE